MDVSVQSFGVADVLEDPGSEICQTGVLRKHQSRPRVTLCHVQGRDRHSTPHLLKYFWSVFWREGWRWRGGSSSVVMAGRWDCIHGFSCVIVALQSVTVKQPYCLVNGNPTAAFFRLAISLVSCVHVFLREVTAQKIKVGRIHSDQPWIQHVLDLLALIRKAISIHETPTFRRVPMQVDIICHTPLLWWHRLLFLHLWYC